MGLQSDRFGGSPRRLHVITLSGAHGTGKSTLVTNLADIFRQRGIYHATVPSCSTAWFLQNKARAEARDDADIPVTYDDINRLGIRAQMQSELPGVLSVSLRVAVEEAIAKDFKDTVVIVDRWFSDILAYTYLEMSEEDAGKLNEGIDATYKKTLDDLEAIARKFGGECYLTHVFIPVHSCGHELLQGKSVDKAHRASGSADAWEAVYAKISRRFTPDQRTIEITSPDRLRRAAEVVGRTFGESPTGASASQG